MLSRFDKIEKVLARRIGKHGDIEYLIRWRGDEDEQDTWEVPGNLTGSCEVGVKFRRGHLASMAATEQLRTLPLRSKKQSLKDSSSILNNDSIVLENGIDEMTPISGNSPEGSEKSLSSHGIKSKSKLKSNSDIQELTRNDTVRMGPGRLKGSGKKSIDSGVHRSPPKAECDLMKLPKQDTVGPGRSKGSGKKSIDSGVNRSPPKPENDLVKLSKHDTVGPTRPKGSGKKSLDSGQSSSPENDQIKLSKQDTVGPGRPKGCGKKSLDSGQSRSPENDQIKLSKQDTVGSGRPKGPGKKLLDFGQNSSPLKADNDLIKLSKQDIVKARPGRPKGGGKKSVLVGQISLPQMLKEENDTADLSKSPDKATGGQVGRSKKLRKSASEGQQSAGSKLKKDGNIEELPKKDSVKGSPGKQRGSSKKNVECGEIIENSGSGRKKASSKDSASSSISPKSTSSETSPTISGRVTRIRRPPVRLGDIIPCAVADYVVASSPSVKSESMDYNFVVPDVSPEGKSVSSTTDVTLTEELESSFMQQETQKSHHGVVQAKVAKELVKSSRKEATGEISVGRIGAKKPKLMSKGSSTAADKAHKPTKVKTGATKSEGFVKLKPGAKEQNVKTVKKTVSKEAVGATKPAKRGKGSIPKVVSTKAKPTNAKVKAAKKLMEKAVAQTPSSKNTKLKVKLLYPTKNKTKLGKVSKDSKDFVANGATSHSAETSHSSSSAGSPVKSKAGGSPKSFNINNKCPNLMKLLKNEVKVCMPKFSPKRHGGKRPNKLKSLQTVKGDGIKGSPKKGTKRKVESDTSSDDDVLYSLNEDFVPKGSKNSKKPNIAKKLLLDRMASSHQVRDSDEEIVFNLLSPATKKMLLKDSIRPKTKIVKPVPRKADGSMPSLTIPARKTALIYPDSTPYKTPPSSPPQSASQSPGSSMCHGDTASSQNMDTYINDLPSIPVIPIIPNSPSAASYKNFIKNLPQKLQAQRGLKRKHSSSDNEDDDGEVVERRVSVRQSESAFKYKEIVVKKCPGYTQIWLFTSSKLKNALNPKVFQELGQALHNAKFDDSHLVMLTGSGSTFCSGIDLHYLLGEDRRTAAKTMADAAKEFVNTLISFPKPVVAAVNGPAIGFGVALLPLCDIIYASDKASFYCPYARLGQTPEGCASYTFPQVMGMAMASELLLGGRKLTAIEAYQMGLVSQVFWPTSMMQEVVPRVQNMATHSGKALEASKMLLRGHQSPKLQLTSVSEWQLLQDRWASAECQRAMRAYLEDETDLLF